MALYSDKAGIFRINNKNAIGGDGHTQFGRAMHELNIQTIFAETSQAKGRVERAHSTLQDRLVKEFRLRNISSIEAANAFTDEFIDDYNHRFGKLPRHEYDVHRPLEQDEDLDTILTIREYRKVSKNLTVQYDKIVYLIEDSEYSRRAIGKCIDVYHYPDERKELRLNGIPFPLSHMTGCLMLTKVLLWTTNGLAELSNSLKQLSMIREITGAHNLYLLVMVRHDAKKKRQAKNPSALSTKMTC